MPTSTLVLCVLIFAGFAYFAGYRRSISIAENNGGIPSLHSLPRYYGSLSAIWCGLPALVLLLLWFVTKDSVIIQMVIDELPAQYRDLPAGEMSLVVNELKNVAANSLSSASDPAIAVAAENYKAFQAKADNILTALCVALALVGFVLALRSIQPKLRARNQVESVMEFFFLLSSCIAILTTVGIVFSVLFESIRFFKMVPAWDFLFGTTWSPQIALRADQAGSSGSFGAIPLFVGTLLISFIAMLIAVPAGLMSAIYLSEYADRRVRSIAKPALEILAGVPTVVYGFFAALTVAPFIRNLGESIGLEVSSESALAAGLVMGVMIIPFVSSLSDDVINAVPQSLRDGSLALGATKSETITLVIIPAALPGIVGGVLLAVSRAIGETMIVVMAAGLAANLTVNPLEAVTTVTVQIVTLLVGDQEFDSAKTLAAFALGLMLFLTTLALNFVALHIVKKYREQYE